MEGEGRYPLKELLDGCICCTGSEQTEAQLQGLLEENEDIDVILIETTGAAHPVEALDAIYSPLFADRLIRKRDCNSCRCKTLVGTG